jgi:SAM-dependent methyltransferase
LTRKRYSLRPELNTSRYWLNEWIRSNARRLTGEVIVLDAGAGEAPYRNHFAHVEYRTADFAAVDKVYGEIDYICDLSSIPVPDSTFDIVLASQVLEHMSEPIATLSEFKRVLKPSGELWLTAPLFFPEHEQPYDFFRYTQFAWRKFADDVGFKIVELEWLEGYDGTLSYQFAMAARASNKWNISAKVLYYGLAAVYARRDMRRRRTSVGMPKNYRVIMTPLETSISLTSDVPNPPGSLLP